MEANYLSAKKVLSTILLNSDTSSVLDEYIVSYLELHPHLVTKYINKKGLYHVYYRTQDTYIDSYKSNNIITLLKSAATEEEAVDWILKHGNDIVDAHKDNMDDPVVLTIIYFDNQEVYEPGEEPSELHMISGKHYLSFAFSKEGFDMLLKEFQYMIEHDWDSLVIPYWITYVRKNKFVYFGKQDLLKIQKSITYLKNDKEKKLEELKDFEIFNADPQAYIKNKKSFPSYSYL